MTRVRWARRSAVALATAIVVAVAVLPGAASANGGQSKVFPPGSSPYGKSYGQWSAAWWQWAFSVPASVNPLLDETGVNCGQGQSGKVFYLGGVFNASGTAARTCTVPDGKALFFPIINVESDNQICLDPDTTFSVKELRANAKALMDQVTDLHATVDGVAIPLGRFRVTSPKFNLTLPADSIGCGEPAGTYGPAVGDGWYLMVKPLSDGVHTISFAGGIPGVFTLDISYTLRVR